MATPEPDELADFYVHTISVEPYLGDGAYGATYGPPVTVPCFLDDTTKLVRAGSGEETVSSATAIAAVSWADQLPEKSRVTLLDRGRVTTIIARGVHTSGGLQLPDHVEVNLE